ncbi:MAG: protoheme IX farnesyltransferase [Deltaproteobacteria bacterium]|nr:protoheme IX farnesyltransferase [Deltaproteobacteria bacterium]
MSPQSGVLAMPGGDHRTADFLALTKPRVVVMVLLTTLIGFYLGSKGEVQYFRMAATILGTGLAAAGTLALNQYLERDLDARMKRTRRRPLPDGRLQPLEALVFGALLVAAGLLYLTLSVNALSGLVTATTVITYLFVYTPMKRRSSLCTVVGAVPGALPPLTGWAAARGDLSVEGWILFAIMFLWQLPHSLAIAWLYREDYARAGMKLLPVIEPDGESTARQVVINSFALLVVGLLPTLAGIAGSAYFAVAFVLGSGLLACGVYLARVRSATAARRMMFATLVYLPLLLITMALDKLAL